MIAIAIARVGGTHGTAYVEKPSKQLAELVGEDGFIEIPPGQLFAFNNLIRASILYFIALQDRPRDEVLEILDRSPSDPSAVAGLAGLPTSTGVSRVETKCSAPGAGQPRGAREDRRAKQSFAPRFRPQLRD